MGSYSVQCTRCNTPENNKLPQLVKRVVSCMEEATHQFSPFHPFIVYKKLHTVYPMLYKLTLKNSNN